MLNNDGQIPNDKGVSLLCHLCDVCEKEGRIISMNSLNTVCLKY